MNYIHRGDKTHQTRAHINAVCLLNLSKEAGELPNSSRWQYRIRLTALICLLGFILNFSYNSTIHLWQTAQAQHLTPTDSLTVDTSDIEASRAIFYNVKL